jgi:addiction module HigA family antidote
LNTSSVFCAAVCQSNIWARRLARDIKVPVGRISDIIHGRRGISPDTALRLSAYFKTTPEFWLNLQLRYDVKVASEKVETATGSLGVQVAVDADIHSVETADFIGLVFVGGRGAERYFKDPKVMLLVQQAVKQGKVVAGICIAPSILANAGVLKGKKAGISRFGTTAEYGTRIALKKFNLQEYYKQPHLYRSIFQQYIQHLSILMNCIYWDKQYPRLITKECMKENFTDQHKLQVIGDISADINGSIEFTEKITTPDNPVFIYNPIKDDIIEGFTGNGIIVLAIDNLPCELPKESSQYFSSSILSFIPPSTSKNIFFTSFYLLEFLLFFIFGKTSSMKPCPPKPGLTDMIRTKSRSSRTGERVFIGVAGLSTMPGLIFN